MEERVFGEPVNDRRRGVASVYTSGRILQISARETYTFPAGGAARICPRSELGNTWAARLRPRENIGSDQRDRGTTDDYERRGKIDKRIVTTTACHFAILARRIFLFFGFLVFHLHCEKKKFCAIKCTSKGSFFAWTGVSKLTYKSDKKCMCVNIFLITLLLIICFD